VPGEIWTILKVLQWTQGRFSERGLQTARLDAELLLAEVLGRDRVGLYTHFDQPLAADELQRYRELIKRRLAGEPVAYLVGRREFRSLELRVDERVLVPRPETEFAVEVALALLPEVRDGERPRVVDVGTGSGAIALAIKSARPDVEVLAIDRSPGAAEVARANAERLHLEIEILVGDLLAPAASRAPFDLIVSNPPYVPSGDLPQLAPEVLREPHDALDGGPDGLTVIRRLLSDARPLLRDSGALVLELGAGQAPRVADLLSAAGYATPTVTRDLAAIDRIISARPK
jgi:release factor glutamine methyltransferase